jgi:hypothetical protein
MLCALIALGALLGGCGGSDDSGGDAAAGEASAGQAEGGNSDGGAGGEGAGDGGAGDGGAGSGAGSGAGRAGEGNDDGGGSGGGRSGKSGSQGGADGNASGERPVAPQSLGGPKNKFAEEADEICRKRSAEILLRVEYYVQERLGKGKSEAAIQAEAVDRIFVPNVKEQVKAIRELEPPEGEEETAEAFIAAMEEGIGTTERKTYTAANVEGLGEEYHKASKLAKAFGVESCGFGA